MFNAFLNYSASTYEAIILAFIVVGLIQSIALWRKSDQVDELKKAIKKVIHISMESMVHSAREVNDANRRAREAERLAMELQADADDAADDAGTLRDPFGRDLPTFLRGIGRDPISDLLEKLSSRGRPDVVGRASGLFERESYSAGHEFSTADLKDALTGDLEGIERRHGAVPGSVQVEVLRADGSPVSDSERETLLDIINRADTTVEAADARGDVTTLNEYAHGFEDHGPSGGPNFGVKVEHIDPYNSPRAG